MPKVILSLWTLAVRSALVAGGTAWGVDGSEGLGNPLSRGAGARWWVGADLGNTATVARRPKP